MNIKRIITAYIGAGVLSFGCIAQANTPSVSEFKNPDKPYLPKTWMHAMNGNLTKPGFSKDFKAMADAGIGGAIFFHVHSRNWPYSSRGPVRFGTDAFYNTLVHAAGAANKHDIEFGIHNADGWTSSGGPWITPDMSMKRVTWSEQAIQIKSDGEKIIPMQPGFAENYYRDIAVIALPENTYNQSNHFANAILTSSDPSLNTAVLSDKNWDTEFEFKKNTNAQYWVQAEVSEPTTLRSLQIEMPNRHGDAALQISDDGIHFTTVVEKLRRPRTGARMWALSPQLEKGYHAKYFRIVFTHPVTIKRFDLWAIPRFDDWLSMNSMERGKTSMTPTVPTNAVIKQSDVRVLHRGELPTDGVSLPKGNWRLLRFGYTSTGAYNVPATIEGEGLECDKFDPKAVRFHVDQYVGKLAKKINKKGYSSFKVTEIDSYEVGGQNWTEGIDRTFKQKFGYDIITWLPIMTGRVIESSKHTGAIAHEFRQHQSDLMVENYFGEFVKAARELGLETYIEPYGWGPFDDLAAGGKADRLMGEFWVRDTLYNGRVSAAISSAHIYGKKIVSAESFTSIRTVNWYGHPYFYKHYGDKMWARGINETMFHRYAHQPNTHVKPGMTMDSIGSHIDSTQTWWSNSGVAWFDYLARGSYLLQQGLPDNDVLVHLGDQAPLKVGNGNNTGVPDGYGYDYTNSDVLINRIRVEDGWLVLPEGTRYKVLHLNATKHMALKTLERVKQLVAQGATVIGHKPKNLIGYSEWPQQAAFNRIANQLWPQNTQQITPYKKGRVSNLSLEETLNQLNILPDLLINGKAAKFFTQRRINNNDLYYFYNDKPRFQHLDIDIRDGDGQPEIWHVDDGSIEPIRNYIRHDKRLKVTLPMEPFAGRFVLIRRDKNTPRYTGTHTQLVSDVYSRDVPTQKIDGPWEVTFDKAWAGPGTVTFNTLSDWINHTHHGIKYYSGTALYTKTLTLTAEQVNASTPLYLDLGDVQHTAQVSVNSQPLGTLWKPPYALDIKRAVQVGENTLQVKVTNNWVNRLIGDEALPDTSGYSMTGDTVPWLINNEKPPKSQRVTFTGYNFFVNEKQKELQTSGLLGPVRLIQPKP